LMFYISYDGAQFGAETIERMAWDWQHLLESTVAMTDTLVEDLPMLSAREREQLLVEWNRTERDYGAARCIHEQIEEQAARTPEAVAVVYEGQQLSYGELNGRANQVGHYLRGLGVGPEVRVAVCMERSLEMVIGLLGVLKAGGAYVPLDPGYPRERLAYMLEDSQALLLLTHGGGAQELAEESVRRVSLEAEWESIGGGSRENPGRKGSGENLAYVIYTSGSTGQPKGAMNTQAGIMNRLAWMQQEYGLESRDRVLQKTSFSFDVSVWELFWPLQTGAVLVMARPGGEQDVGYMKEVMEEEEISTVHFVPSMLEVFVGEWERGRCGNLRRVISSGEELKGGLVERFYAVERGNRGKLHNLYGPTETAVEVTFHECEEEGEGKRVAIGRPIGNLRMYVLDEWGGPAPIGV